MLYVMSKYNVNFPSYTFPIFNVKIGVGLMIFQQFGGINGICFYASSIFVSAGMYLE